MTGLEIAAIASAAMGALGMFTGNASSKKLKKKELAEMAKNREAQVGIENRKSQREISANRVKAIEDMAEGFRASLTSSARRR
jgi:hypothetical protein